MTHREIQIVLVYLGTGLILCGLSGAFYEVPFYRWTFGILAMLYGLAGIVAGIYGENKKKKHEDWWLSRFVKGGK
jgi:hypothetical protein